MPENNLKQADLPEGAEVIRNPLGTAPGFRMPVPQADGHISHLIVMPGVPREMKPMMEDSVIPWLGRIAAPTRFSRCAFSRPSASASRDSMRRSPD